MRSTARLLWALGPTGDGLIGGHRPPHHLGQLSGVTDLEERFEEMARADPADLAPSTAARAAWLVGLGDQVYRAGIIDNPHLYSLAGAGTWDALLAAIPDAWVTGVEQVAANCKRFLVAHRAAGRAKVNLSFEGSAAVGGADADYLIADGLLVEITAVRSPFKNLRRTIQQVVSYALLDWDDQHSIEGVALLFARQGILVEWPLQELLDQMADQPVSVQELRNDFRRKLLAR